MNKEWIHLWKDELINDQMLGERLESLPQTLADDLQLRLDTVVLTDACERLIQSIGRGKEEQLFHLLEDCGQTKEQAENLVEGICRFMQKDNIRKRLKSDLGSYHPFDLSRTDYDKPVFEAWKPLGVQVHIVPGNALNVPVLSTLEGLMAGNINILKNTSRNGLFTQHFFKRLAELDATGILKHFVYILEISSGNTEQIQAIINQADVVCVWGGEEAVQSVRAMTPSNIRFVDWGHKISFAYFSSSAKNNEKEIEELARDICRRNQQACTSPQCVLVETEDNSELDDFARRLAKSLDAVEAGFVSLQPSMQEQAEIATITHLQRAEAAMGYGQVIESPVYSYRVLIDYRPGLQPSPLFRTIWVKPVQRAKLVATLRPFNMYLQTCGLSCTNVKEMYELTELLLRAGVQRITKVGGQHESYVGEPHDGVYALQRYTKRVGVRFQEDLVKAVPGFEYLRRDRSKRHLDLFPITDKTLRQNEHNPAAKLYLKSGGSSGETKIAGYSWEDWNLQMEVMAESYMIGGIVPADKCAILYSAGNMYGGFIATLKAFEKVNCTAITLSSNLDTQTIAETIISTGANVVLGMPSFLRKLFREEYNILKGYNGFEKLVYGGELMTEEQKSWFRNEFGFSNIFSPAYASNDALMNGYACGYCGNGEFHVPVKVMDLEILKKESNEPVEGGETGRILITKKSIKDPELLRYEIGDLGRWIGEECPCGHTTPKFKLMGRFGDLVRCGAKFINYREICRFITETFGYTDDIQMLIASDAASADKITIKVLPALAGKENEVRAVLLEKMKDLKYAVDHKNAGLEITVVDRADLEIAKASGKVRPIVDLRKLDN